VVRSSNKKLEQHGIQSGSQNQQKEYIRIKREISLLKTLAVAICAFLACWIPHGILVLFFAETASPGVKKV